MKRWRYYVGLGLPVLLAVGGVVALGYWWWSTSLPDYRMRRAFLRAFGQPPQVIRRNARAELAA